MDNVERLEKEAEVREALEANYTTSIIDIYFSKSVAKLNQIVGLVPGSQFSMGLFLKLGINFGLIHVKEENEFFIPKNMDMNDNDNVVEIIVKNMRAYVIRTDLSNDAKVNMKFTYHNKEQLDLLLEAFATDIGISFLTFVYLHEVQHILRRHNTTMFDDIMLKTAQTHDPKYTDYGQIHSLVNIAEDYCINNALEDLFSKSGDKLRNEVYTISKYGMFDKELIDEDEANVLLILLKRKPDITVVSEDEHTITLDIQNKKNDGSNDGDPIRTTIPKQQTSSGGDFEQENEANKEIEALANSIENHIDNQKKMKGEGKFLLDEELGKSIKTNVDWFDSLKSDFYTIVYRKTKQTIVNWARLNNKYRHSHNSPTHKNIDNQLDIVLSVDNSGSMSNDQLRKLLYIIEQKKKKISNLTILKHTDGITGKLINEKDDKKILEFLSKRDNGGTSHREVFEFLDDKLDARNIEKSIFISFSDNHSDIETQYGNYKNIGRIQKIWLNSGGRAVEDFIPGSKIDIF